MILMCAWLKEQLVMSVLSRKLFQVVETPSNNKNKKFPFGEAVLRRVFPRYDLNGKNAKGREPV
jgi:hypothetical protein